MSFPFDGLPDKERSSLTGFSGNTIRRDSEYRDAASLEKAVGDDRARFIAIGGNGLYLKHDRTVFDALFAAYELAPLQPDLEDAVLLGYREDGAPRLAVNLAVAEYALPDHVQNIDLRSVLRRALLPDDELGLVAQGASLLRWNARTRFCGHCGGKSISQAAGYERICSDCDAKYFPRTDPVVIMLALRNDHCLLGRSPHFPPGMYSCLAGFVEPGETIEDAVRRETHEESGIAIGRVAYHASQPWPFPHTLMIGCYGEALSETIDRDTEELEDCRWFSRTEAASMLEGQHESGLIAPFHGAIANLILADWLRSQNQD